MRQKRRFSRERLRFFYWHYVYPLSVGQSLDSARACSELVESDGEHVKPLVRDCALCVLRGEKYRLAPASAPRHLPEKTLFEQFKKLLMNPYIRYNRYH